MRAVCRIAGVGHYLPARAVSTEELESLINSSGGFKTPPGLLARLTGVQNRFWRAEDEQASDLAANATNAALADAGYSASDVDVLIFASASQDVSEPATANIVQAKVGALSAHVFDVKNACSSALNAIDIARLMIQAGQARVVVVASGEVLSFLVHPKLDGRGDLEKRLASFTLGDAGSALVLDSLGSETQVVMPGSYRSDGTHWELCTVMAGGSVTGDHPPTPELITNSPNLILAGTPLVAEATKCAMETAGWGCDDVDLFVPHQFNQFFVDYLVYHVGLPREAGICTLERVGNTAATSIPMALSIAKSEGRLPPASRVLLVSAAAGAGAAAIPLVW